MQQHIHQHIRDFIAIDVGVRDGQLVDLGNRWRFLPSGSGIYQELYVDPRTGLIRLNKDYHSWRHGAAERHRREQAEIADRRAPRPTLFIKGNHEDFVWLDTRQDAEVLPNLSYLRNGCTVDIQDAGAGAIRVGGIGGCYGPSDYRRCSDQLQGYAKRHYTFDEIERLADSGGVDILLTHDAPAGVRFERHRRGTGYVSEAAGLDVLLAEVQPRVCFFGHHPHTRVDAEVAGVCCIGLNKIAMPGNLVAEHASEVTQRVHSVELTVLHDTAANAGCVGGPLGAINESI